MFVTRHYKQFISEGCINKSKKIHYLSSDAYYLTGKWIAIEFFILVVTFQEVFFLLHRFEILHNIFVIRLSYLI